MLSGGFTRTRPPANASQAHPGIQPLAPLTHTQRFQPLPTPLGLPPYHLDLETVLPGVGAHVSENGALVFHTVGDTGGIKEPSYQELVTKAMREDLALPDAQRPAFFYHLGDVVYYNGQLSEYYGQFYEPYDHYDVPVFSIPGNHDGDPFDATQVSLDAWMAFFMTAVPHVNPESMDAPRMTMTQPNPYFTLVTPLATIIGMYTNVPEGGSIDSIQQQWLTHEFYSAAQDRALIVALHHPIYSFDDHHSGSARMADVLQHAINDSRRVPNMVLNGHVHNYQRIERTVASAGPVTPFIVAGHGGYWHLHGMNAEDGTEDPDTHANLVYSNHKCHGYVTLTLNGETISGTMTAVDDRTMEVNRQDDTFSYPAAAQFLADGEIVSL